MSEDQIQALTDDELARMRTLVNRERRSRQTPGLGRSVAAMNRRLGTRKRISQDEQARRYRECVKLGDVEGIRAAHARIYAVTGSPTARSLATN